MEEEKQAHKDQVREHYNRHVKPVLNTKEALTQRAQSETYPLKKFHNDVKRQLLLRFAKGKQTLLDLCCGRGGDILKWNDLGLSYVRGVDISDQEVAEASRRFAELGPRKKGQWDADFQVETNLGELPYDGDGPYDVITCMFAMHYFFESEARLRMFLRNVSNNLAPGGYFIGTIPDAKRVLWHMGDAGRMNSPMLKLQKDWKGSGPFPSQEVPWPSPFGHRFYFAVTDTVTAGTEGSAEGSMEFLAFQSPIIRIAAHYGMVAVLDYDSPGLDRLLEAESAGQPFKHFFPQFPSEVDASLAVASSINTAFVFRKLLPEEEMPPLVPPLPSQLPQQPSPRPPGTIDPAAAGQQQPPYEDPQGPVGEQENEQGAQEEQMQGVSGDGFEHEKEDDEHHRYLMDAEMEEQGDEGGQSSSGGGGSYEGD
uniref:mRNA (guanine-N(7))-methyltransferase n=1 Tax=Dunaliella tertiolecta TaxID=3047 RepID=A0A7S3VKL6_DUNTE